MAQLWCDKYRPKRFAEFSFHQEQAQSLKKIVQSDNFPHLFVSGPSGAGKRTIVRCLLQELFGASSQKLKIEHKVLEANSGKKIEHIFKSSNFHLEIDPSQNGFYDRVVVQELIKDVATSVSLSKKHHFKVVVIDQSDRLTKEAQQSLRRTLEKYVSTCRVILIAERSSRIIPALRSRCLIIQIASPTEQQVRTMLKKVVKAEAVSIRDTNLEEIIEHSQSNVRRAIEMLEMFTAEKEKNPIKNTVELFKWEEKIYQLAGKLTESQSVRKISEIRASLYDLLVHLIPTEIILRTLIKRLLTNACIDDRMRSEVISIAAEADHRIAVGSKPVIHLEWFCVKFMMLFRLAVEKIDFDGDDDFMDFE